MKEIDFVLDMILPTGESLRELLDCLITRGLKNDRHINFNIARDVLTQHLEFEGFIHNLQKANDYVIMRRSDLASEFGYNFL